MTQDNTQDDMLLDETLDDLADLPATQPFAAGAHLVSMKVKRNAKKVGQFIVEMTHKATVELTNPNDTEPKEGDKSTVFISTKKKDGTANEIGQGQLKVVLKPIAAMLGSSSINDCVQATKDGLDMIVVVTIRKGNEDYPDDRQDIKKAELAE